ncbi:hypothetical protein [Alienimonas sp. DA493]|uniref:hypothetical protein n=1 Tax=Alienimonas sp. DA493 TaxID=3373605 RepID=UPI0037547F32
MSSPATFAVACGLAAAHLIGGRLRFLDRLPRSRWLSLAGGVAVAYATVHLLPELAEVHATLARAAGESRWAADHGGYLVALLGLTCFYGLERLAARSADGAGPGEEEESRGEGRRPPASVFWLHVGSYAAYNVLFGVLLVDREDDSVRSLVLFACAIALHFVVNDHGLRAHHPVLYPRYGRWLVAAAPPVGWAVGTFAPLPTVAVDATLGFLIGGVLLNVFKEELPAERQSRFWAFVGGAAAYAAVLAAV